MTRSGKLLALVFLAFLASPCVPALASSNGAAPENSAVSQIYSSFLQAWNGKGHLKLNVAKSAAAPTADEVSQFADCAHQAGMEHVQWGTAKPVPDLTTAIGGLPFVHLVDPEQWHADDPMSLIAQGSSVKSAVNAGFAHGLLTLSAITFNTSHTVAIFQYWFGCGSTCGSTSIVVFRKTQAGWVEAKPSCFMGMS